MSRRVKSMGLRIIQRIRLQSSLSMTEGISIGCRAVLKAWDYEESFNEFASSLRSFAFFAPNLTAPPASISNVFLLARVGSQQLDYNTLLDPLFFCDS